MSTDNSEPPDNVRALFPIDEMKPLGISPAEGLRLMSAFLKLKDPADRALVIELAERLAR